MNKNIKYLIEKTVRFEPSEYTDDDIIENGIIDDITDPVNNFVSFLNNYNWKKYKRFHTDGVHIIEQNLKLVWNDIYKQISKLAG